MTDERHTTSAAFTYAFDPRRALLILTYRRQPSASEWEQLMAAALASADYVPGMTIVSDRRSLDETAAAPTIHRMAAWVMANRETLAGCRWAVVVAPERIAEYGMARMGTALFARAGIRLEVFTSFDAAMRWAAAPAEPGG